MIAWKIPSGKYLVTALKPQKNRNGPLWNLVIQHFYTLLTCIPKFKF